jgi:hypothetical protein
MLEPEKQQQEFIHLEAKDMRAVKRTWLIKTKESVSLEPRTRQIVAGMVSAENRQKTPSLVCIEPAKIHIEGVLAARTLARVESAIDMNSLSEKRCDSKT